MEARRQTGKSLAMPLALLALAGDAIKNPIGPVLAIR
jgi:hypothetical protein